MDALEDDDPHKRNAALTSALHHGGSRLKKLAEGAWVYVVALNCAEFVQARSHLMAWSSRIRSASLCQMLRRCRSQHAGRELTGHAWAMPSTL